MITNEVTADTAAVIHVLQHESNTLKRPYYYDATTQPFTRSTSAALIIMLFYVARICSSPQALTHNTASQAVIGGSDTQL
jgi:hypothetical protein